MESQQYSLRWNNYLRHITCAFDSLRSDKDLVDVTLSCDGQKVHAHKMLLSACSSYFRDLFKENPCQHPVIIFRNVRFEDLIALVDFMYQGEVNVEQEQLASFLNTAELLQVQGLTNSGTVANNPHNKDSELNVPVLTETSFGSDCSPRYPSEEPPSQSVRPSSSGPAVKRRRWQRTQPSSPVTVTPVLPGIDGDSETSTRASSPVNILPMKIEVTDYDRNEDTPREDTTENTLARLRENEELLLTKSSDIKVEHYEYDLRTDTQAMDILQTSGDADTVTTAGPSNDGHTQDGLQPSHNERTDICQCSVASKLNKGKQIQLYEGYDVFIGKIALDEAVDNSKGNPAKLMRLLLQAIKGDDYISQHSAGGQREKTSGLPACDADLLRAVKGFVHLKFRNFEGKLPSMKTVFNTYAANIRLAKKRRDGFYIYTRKKRTNERKSRPEAAE